MSLPNYPDSVKLVYWMAKLNKVTWPVHRTSNLWISPVEKRMISGSKAIRIKPEWFYKAKDADTIKSWRSELKTKHGLTDSEAAYVINELKYYASVEHACVGSNTNPSAIDMVWTSSISNSDLKRYVSTVLEEMPEKWKSWSDILKMKHEYDLVDSRTGKRWSYGCRVLSLVDPGLYPLDYLKTPISDFPSTSTHSMLTNPEFGKVPGSKSSWDAAICKLNQKMRKREFPISEFSLTPSDEMLRYAWLPSEIHVDRADGHVEFQSYINNLHPIDHAEAYDIIAPVISKCIPLVEQVLTDLVHRREFRVPVNIDECISETVPLPTYDLSDLFDIYSDSLLDTLSAWESGVIYNEPSPGIFVSPKRPMDPYSLRGEQLQVFIQMTNVYLTPETPECASEIWKSAGTQAEHIVATAIYLYDVDNIEQVSIDMRESVEMHEGVDLRDHFDSVVYELNNTDGISEYSNNLGSIQLNEGDIVCYPNTYQRRILPLKLSDQTRAGHIK
ncbi:hypothetical protein GGI05_005052, partial [Coemansia sp. RSA 2603]